MRFPLQIDPGIVSDDTVLARAGHWIDGSLVRWVRGRPQLIGGWERLVLTALTGVCRNVFAWIDNSSRLNIAFGTHSRLFVFRGGALYDITPYRLPMTLGANPLTVTNGSPVVTVAHTAHGLTTADQIIVTGATAVGGITPNGTFAVTVLTADSYTYTFGSNATSGATGGGSAVVVSPQVILEAGQIDGTGGQGYGTGAYGVGKYSEPSIGDYFPRTWSLAALGQALIASPRGGAIFLWENNTATRAAPLTNAPTENTHVIVTPERVVMAIGTQEEVSGTFNPRCLRHSDPRDETVWNTGTATLAREKILEGAGRLVAGRVAGYGNFIFTDNDLWDCRYQGSIDEVFTFTKLGEKCGLMGPNAVVTDDQTAFWLGPDFQFRTTTLGGEPQVIESPMRDMVEENLATVQKDKVVAATIAGFNEVWFFYPDGRDGLENSRAVCFSKADGWWSKHELARTAFCNAGPASYPVGVTTAGAIYWHERGKSADGDAITWSLESGPQYIDSGENLILFRDFVPDFRDQEGAINLTMIIREESQSPAYEFGPLMITPTTTRVGMKGVGRLVSFRLSGSSGPAFWRLGTPIFEGRAAGRR